MVRWWLQDGSLCVFDVCASSLVTKCSGFPSPDVTSVDFHPVNDNRLFAACGEAVAEFDLRYMGTSFDEFTVNRW